MRKIILFIISVIAISAFAQTDYYYFKGQRIPLTVNPKKVNVISMANGPQFAPAANPNALPTGLEVEAVISGNPYNMCVIENKTSNIALLHNYLNYIVNPNYNIVHPCYLNSKGEEVIPSGYIYIKLKKESDILLLQILANNYNLRILHQNAYMPKWYVLYMITNGEDTLIEKAKNLYETNFFEAVEPDLMFNKIFYNSISWDERVDEQWGLYNTSNDSIDINVSSAWNYATGRGVKVGIFDSYVDCSHPDLKDNIGNLKYGNMPETTSEFWLFSHGTHVAGIVGAIRNNGIFGTGVAPDVQLVPMALILDYKTPLVTEKIANGFNWAVKNNVDIINCSWAWERYEIITDAIDNALENGRNGKGCIVVFSSGNENNLSGFPANYRKELMSIGSINKYGFRAQTSNYGSEIDVVAPGDTILSTLPEGDVGIKSGTSMAAPHVAGIAALILELNPDLTGQQVRDIIEQSTTKVGMRDYEGEYTTTPGRPNGTWNQYYGYGLVDALKAVQNTPRKQIEY